MPDIRPLEALYQDLRMLSPTHQSLFFELLRKEGETLAQLGIPRRVAPDAPLSYAQKRIWNAGRHAPAEGVDNVPLAVRLEGPLDVDALRRSLEAIAERHEILRSSIRVEDGTPRLVVSADWALPFEVVPGSVPDEDLLHRARRPFDTAADPLLRVTLYEQSITDHVLLITLHQLVGDGLSLRLMLRELSSLYAAGGAADAADLPERHAEYADVATWQRTWMSEEDLAVQRAYWEEQLAGVAGVAGPTRLVDATTDTDERTAHPSAAVSVTFSTDLSDRLRRLAMAQGATSYMAILAALYATLAAETGEKDLLVASLVSSRTLPETETLLGNFSNTLLLRRQITGRLPFSDFLQQVKADVLDAYRHQDFPFVEMQRLLHERASVPDDAPPYLVMLIVRDSRLEDEVRLENVEARVNLVNLGQSRLPFSIDLVDDGDGPIAGRLTYATDVFDRSVVEAFIDRLTGVLRRVGTNSSVSVNALSARGGTASTASPSTDLAREIQKVGF